MNRKVATPDARIAEIAGRQYGVVSTHQLRRAGVGEKGIRGRVQSGRLHRVHRGVFAVGHVALAPEGRWLAAAMAIGGGPHDAAGRVLDRWGAALSHRSAASLWRLLPVTGCPVDVIVPGLGGRARRSGVRVHRSRSLALGEVTLHRGIPVTTPARTIADLRAALRARKPHGEATAVGGRSAISRRELRGAIRQANVLGLPIGEKAGRDRTRSDLERDFIRICRRHCLPPPEVNVRVGPFLRRLPLERRAVRG